MPPRYLAIHALLFLAAGGVSWALARRSRRWGLLLALAAVALGLPAQVLVLERPRACANLLAWSDLFFFHKFSVHLAAVIVAAAVTVPERRAVRLRSAALGAVLLGVAAYASRDVFVAPPPLAGPEVLAAVAPVTSGAPMHRVLRQTERSSCAPAAAATLLRALGIDPGASEAALARDCFTHPGEGTSDLGLYRGLRLAAPGRRVRFFGRSLEELRARREPCIVFVGLERSRVPDPALFAFLRDRCSWREGEVHAVVWFGFGVDSSEGRSWEVAVIGDPTFGLERWALEHFVALWDGSTLEVE